LEKPGFEFALDADAGIRFFQVHDDGGVGPAQQFGEDYAGLGEAVVVGLQAGEDEIELFVFDGGGDGSGGVERIDAYEGRVFEVDGAIRSLGQSLPQYLLCARGTGVIATTSPPCFSFGEELLLARRRRAR